MYRRPKGLGFIALNELSCTVDQKCSWGKITAPCMPENVEK